MVAIVSGNSLGLNLTSMSLLGGVGPTSTQPNNGVFGNATQGSSKEATYVNAATGNLIVQDTDAVLAGIDNSSITGLRTYNSLGGWNYAATKTIVNVNSTTYQYVDVDGSVATFTGTAGGTTFTQTGGGHDDAFNTLKVNSDGTVTWTNGSTGATELFSSTGVLKSATDALGNVTTYQYDTNGKLTQIVDSNGESINYSWTNGLLISVSATLAGGVTLNEVSYTYDASNRLSTVSVNLNADGTVPAGSESGTSYVTTYTYDGTSNRIASITQGDGTAVSFTYVLVSGVYQLASYTDGNGGKSTFTYNSSASQPNTTFTDPYGVVTYYAYSGSTGQLVSVIQGYNPTTGKGVSQLTYAYAASGEVAGITDGTGHKMVYGHDSLGRLTAVVDGVAITGYTYNALNHVVTSTTTATRTPVRYVYSATVGAELRFTISAEGVVTENRYNAQRQLVSTITYDATYPSGTTIPTEAQMQTWAAAQTLSSIERVDYTYDLRGELKTTTTYGNVDASGNGVAATASTTRSVYNQAGQLIQQVAADGTSASNWVYDELGRVVLASTGSADGTTVSTTTTQYDDAHGKVVVTAANGEVTTSVHDAAGRVVSVSQSTSSGVAAVTTYSYDADGRLLMTTDPTGVRSWTMYDAAGRKVADIDGVGNLTEYVYDARNRVTQTLRADSYIDETQLVDTNGSPTTAYNANPSAAPGGASNAVTLAALGVSGTTLENKNSWTYYDASGRVSYAVSALGFVTHTEYDPDSRVVAVIQYATLISTSSLGNGQTAPNWASLIKATAADRQTTYVYSKDGKLTGAIDGDGYLTQYVYDGAGRLVQTTKYATAVAGYPGNTGAVYTAQTQDSLSGLLPATSQSDITSFQLWNSEGKLVGEVDGNGYLTETIYDVDGRVARKIRYATPAVSPMTANSPLAAIRPASTAADQISSVAYDAFGRVALQTAADGTTTTFGYDSVGNLVQTAVAAGAVDQRGILAQYDVQGHLTAQLSPDGVALLTGSQTTAQIAAIWAQYGTTYTYDAAGRLTSTTKPDNDRTVYYYSDDGQLAYTVDADGKVTGADYDMLGSLVNSNVSSTAISAADFASMTGGVLSEASNAAALAAIYALGATTNGSADTGIHYDYDAAERLTLVEGSLGDIGYGYDSFGDRVSTSSNPFMQLGAGGTPASTLSVSYTFDHRGNATSEAETAGLLTLNKTSGL